MVSLPPESLVVQRARQFKAALLAREDAQMREMARRWLQVERDLGAQIESLVREIQDLRDAGKPVSRGRLWRLDRYRTLYRQTIDEFQRYAVYAGDIVTAEQRALGELAIEHTSEVIQLSYWQNGVFTARFDRLPIEAVQNIAGLAGNGQPVGELLKLRMVRDEAGNALPGVWDQLTESLVTGTARGQNPRRVAAMMRDDLSGGLNKAMVIARTEELRAYRQMSADNYRESGVVTGHRRLTAHDARVCPACLADEGTPYPIGVPIGDHPNGRCTSVPVIKDLPAVDWLKGEAWFRAQGKATQMAILGPGRWDAWNADEFSFSALTVKTFDPVWGESLNPAPLKALVQP